MSDSRHSHAGGTGGGHWEDRLLTSTGALKARWSVLMVLITAVLMGVASVGYTAYAQHQTEQRFRQQQRQSDQRWCALLASMDRPDLPQNPRSREIQPKLHELRLGLGCGGG